MPVKITITCYLSLGCGSEDVLRENIAQALAFEMVEANANFFRLDDDKAQALNLSGSPSIFIAGEELQPQKGGGFT